MANRTHDIIADIGTYTDKEGNEKKRWKVVGVMFDNGAIKIETMPVTPEWSGWLKAVEPRDYGSGGAGGRQQPRETHQRPVPQTSRFNSDDPPF